MTTSPVSNFTYRPEIDGLRALAIIPVLLYHFGFFVPGGFLGVDVFFVISGFLITSILLKELSQNSFSLSNFYVRRAKRILPVMVVVTIATLVCVPFVSFPWQVKTISMSALASLLFVANAYFYETINYFTNSVPQPFLHMWSLAIEEQYYVFFPPLLYIVWKASATPSYKTILFVLLFASGLSLIYAQKSYYTDSSSTFYLIQYRAFELGIGSIASAFVFQFSRIKGLLGSLLAGFGIICIVVSYYIFDSDIMPYEKLPLLIGTALILVAYFDTGFVYSILTLKVFRFIGLISFSLYLWHQPVLALYTMRYGDVSLFDKTLLLLFTFCISYVSYRFVETPFRHIQLKKVRVFTLSVGSILLASCVSFGISASFGNKTYTNVSDQSLAKDLTLRTNYVSSDSYKSFKGRDFPVNDKPNVFLIGDSYSQDFYNILSESGYLENINLSAHYVSARCQPYWREELPDGVEVFYKELCKKERSRPPSSSLLEKADYIVFASFFEPWSADRLSQTVADLGILYPEKVIVIGPKSFVEKEGAVDHRQSVKLNLIEYFYVPVSERPLIRTRYNKKIYDSSESLLKQFKETNFVNTLDLTCDSEEKTCPVFTPDGLLISHDGYHLTQEGAKFFSGKIFEDETLDFFKPKQK
jgi:peptidoglycan/LPS O-acetylase OafA/YrhL